MAHTGTRVAAALIVVVAVVVPVRPATRVEVPAARAVVAGSLMGGPDNAGNVTGATGP